MIGLLSTLRGQRTLRIDSGTEGIGVMDQIEMHGDPDRTPPEIGGWLLLLSLTLLIWQPIGLAVTGSQALSALPIRGLPMALVFVARALIAALGIAAGLAILRRRDGAVALTAVALVLAAMADVFILTTSYLPSNRMPGDTPFYIAGSLAYHGAWLTYLFRSDRVRRTFMA